MAMKSYPSVGSPIFACSTLKQLAFKIFKPYLKIDYLFFQNIHHMAATLSDVPFLGILNWAA
jgi:hypothetical protein